MESITQRLVRELFESHLEGAAMAVLNAEKAMLQAQVDLTAAIAELTAAQNDSGPFIPDLNRAPLNIALTELKSARDRLATYTTQAPPPLPNPNVNGANHSPASEAANDLSPSEQNQPAIEV